MDLLNSRDKISIFFILSLVSIIFYGTSGWALDPTVTDVTTRSFSVVWTEGAVINPDSHSCSLTVKMGGVEIDSNQIIEPELDAEGQPNEEGRLGLERGIVKYEVIMLNPNSTYTVNGEKSNGTTSLFGIGSDQTVVTEKFKGLAPEADANDHDIVTNDIFHWPVYDDDGKTPALGAMVMAEIFKDADCTDPNKQSHYAITAWVGANMPGDSSTNDYLNGKFDPNNVTYKEFAALNFNNLFALDSYPLQLKGDDATTPQVEGEYIKITVIPGQTSVAGDLTYKVPVPEITTVGEAGEKQRISSAKAGQKISFQPGMNLFTYPFDMPAQLTLQQFVEIIYAAGGTINKLMINEGGWPTMTVECDPDPLIDPAPRRGQLLEPGRGYLIVFQNAPQDFTICNAPTPTKLTLSLGMNVANFNEVPNFYTMQDLVEAIYAAGGTINKLMIYEGGWPTMTVECDPDPLIDPAPRRNQLVERGKAYLIVMGSVSQDPMIVNPLQK